MGEWFDFEEYKKDLIDYNDFYDELFYEQVLPTTSLFPLGKKGQIDFKDFCFLSAGDIIIVHNGTRSFQCVFLSRLSYAVEGDGIEKMFTYFNMDTKRTGNFFLSDASITPYWRHKLWNQYNWIEKTGKSIF